MIHRVADAIVPTMHGEFHCVVYLGEGIEHVALVRGDLSTADPVVSRVHSECLTGDVFGSRRCDCGPQLDAALARVAADNRGAVIYLRGHEGRGIGLGHKIRAYRLQDGGMDTVDANVALGLPIDSRGYQIAAAILHDLGVASVRLITNNPDKCAQLEAFGIDVVERIPSTTELTPENATYLRTKVERMGHLIDLPD